MTTAWGGTTVVVSICSMIAGPAMRHPAGSRSRSYTGVAVKPDSANQALRLSSRACLIEHHVAVDDGAYFTNTITDLVVGRDAEVEHHKLQQESLKAFHIAAVNADQGHGSRFTSRSFALGGGLARVDIRVGLNAEHAACTLDGLYMADGRQHVDHHTRIDHAQPYGTSREFYKGVLAGASRAVFNGRVVVFQFLGNTAE